MMDNESVSPDEYLEILLKDYGNIELFSKIKRFTLENMDFSKYDIKEGIAEDQLLNKSIAVVFDEYVFHALEVVYMFYPESLKCINWIRGMLKNIDQDTSNFFKSLIVEGLKDSRRFNNSKKAIPQSKIDFITNEIDGIDYPSLKRQPDNNSSCFDHFLDVNEKGEYEGLEIDDYSDAYLAVRVILESESELIERYKFDMLKRGYDIKILKGKSKPKYKEKINFEAFFDTAIIDKIKIKAIQEEFKTKKQLHLVFLIFILCHIKKIVTIEHNSKTGNSREAFVKFIQPDLPSMSYINRNLKSDNKLFGPLVSHPTYTNVLNVIKNILES
jgi:hypothetical protein